MNIALMHKFSLCFSCKLFLTSDHGFDAIIHILNKLNLGTSKSSLVGYVIGVVRWLAVLSMDTANLDEKFSCNFLKLIFFLSKIRKLNMDWSPEGSAEVGRARCDVTKTLIMWELGDFFNLTGSSCKSGEYSSNVCSLLHGNDSELILFIHPDKEGLIVVMEDTSSFWPVSVASTSLKESITLFKQEMIFN